MLRFFSPLPKKAKQVPPSGLSPMVSARFPEPKPQERRRVVLAPAVSKKKKDKRGGANRGQGRKKGSLGQKRKREVGEETLSRKLAKQIQKLGHQPSNKATKEGTLDKEGTLELDISTEASKVMMLQSEITAQATAAALAPLLLKLEETISQQSTQILVLQRAGQIKQKQEEAQPAAGAADIETFIVTMGNGNRSCWVCTKHERSFAIRKQKMSPWILGNGGVVGEGQSYYCAKNSHFKSGLNGGPSKMHQLAVEMEKNAAMGLIPRSIRSMQAGRVDQLIKLFKLTNYMAKRNHSFLEFEELVALCTEVGADLGTKLHGKDTCKELLAVLRKVITSGLSTFLNTVNPLMGKKPSLGSAADKGSDPTAMSVQFQHVTGRANFYGEPYNFTVGTTKVDGEFDPEVHASGWSCYNKICVAWESLGVNPREKDKRDLREHDDDNDERIVEQNRTYCFDGEPAYQGQHQGAKHYFQTADGTGDKTVEVVYDKHHGLDCLVEDGQKASEFTPNTIHTTIHGIYKYFAHSGKRTRRLEELAAEEGAELKQMHFVFAIRMVEGEHDAIYNFLWDYGPVVRQLQKDKGEAGCDPKVAGWLLRVRQFKFVAVCLVALDQHKHNKIF